MTQPTYGIGELAGGLVDQLEERGSDGECNCIELVPAEGDFDGVYATLADDTYVREEPGQAWFEMVAEGRRFRITVTEA
jgi:hypothetical protein